MSRDGQDGKSRPADKTTGNADAAERALAEADARRRAADETPRPTREVGRKGPDPARYGDWEKGGIASDF